MKPHKVKHRFKAPEGYIDPPGPWTPPNQELADKFIKAGCLVGPVLPPTGKTLDASPQAPLSDEPKPKRGFLGKRKSKKG